MLPRRRRRAFSLVEVVIALGVASVAIIGILGLISSSLREGRAAVDDRVGVSMAGWILAEARSTLQPGPVDTNFYFDADGMAVAGPNGAIYRIRTVGNVDTDFNDAEGRTNLVRYQLTIYPVAAGANPADPRIIHATVSR